MDTTPRLSRRRLHRLIATAAMGAALPIRGSRAGKNANPSWNLADGVRIAGPVSGPASLDPALSRETGANFLLRHLYRGLVGFDEALEPVPELASQIERSDDSLRYDVTLRPDTRFHDNRPVTPADVEASLTRALDPATVGGNTGALAAVAFLDDIEGADRLLAGTNSRLSGVEITGDLTLSITLSRQAPAFLAKLGSVTASVVDARSAADDPDWAIRPNGSGPYRLAEWIEGESMRLEPASTWWAGEPQTGPLMVRLGASAVLPVNLYQAGEIDLVWGVPAEQVDLVRDPASGVSYGNLVETILFATSYIALSNQVPPLDDVHVRRALQLAFPAASIAGAMFDGAVRAATGIVPPGMSGRDWRVDGPEPDPAAARAELGRSRFGSAAAVPPIRVHAADIRPVEAFRDVVNGTLGITVEAIQVPWQEFVTSLTNQRFTAYSIYWSADYPDPESMLDMLFASGSADNYTGYRNPEFDDLLDGSRHETGEARLDTMEAANRLLVEDVAVIPLYHDIGHVIVRDGMYGVRVTPMGLLGLESLRGDA